MQSKHVKNRHNKMKKKNSNAAVASDNSANEETTLKVVHNANDTTTEAINETNLQTEPTEAGRKSIKAIFEKGNKLQGLMDQYEVLNETAKKLDSFHLGSDKLTDSLQIRDGKGNEFKTNNSTIIEKCVELVKSEVEAKTIHLETQLQMLEAA